MNEQINLYQAKTQLSRLVDGAASGRTIIIAKNGRPLAQLGPITGTRGKTPRRLGQLAAVAKDVDWARWWRDWKAADREIERDFEAAATKPFPGMRTPPKRQGRKPR